MPRVLDRDNGQEVFEGEYMLLPCDGPETHRETVPLSEDMACRRLGTYGGHWSGFRRSPFGSLYWQCDFGCALRWRHYVNAQWCRHTVGQARGLRYEEDESEV